ncbi:uncharacterized protein LOC144084887 isoform X2 [Stigmatopora argus]
MESSRKVAVHALVLVLLLQVTVAQHWSYGWLPGGKRSVGELEATIRMMGTGGVVSLPEEASAQTHERRRPYNVEQWKGLPKVQGNPQQAKHEQELFKSRCVHPRKRQRWPWHKHGRPSPYPRRPSAAARHGRSPATSDDFSRFSHHVFPGREPDACSPGPRRATGGMMSHTCLAGGCCPATLAAPGVALAPMPTQPPRTQPPPRRCLLRPVDVSKWQMMVGVCAAAWEEECQGRSFPATTSRDDGDNDNFKYDTFRVWSLDQANESWNDIGTEIKTFEPIVYRIEQFWNV